jgi:symplekin
MVGLVATSSEKVARLINSAKFAINVPSKLECLRQLKEELSEADPALLSEFIPLILQLHTDSCSPARKFVTEIVGNVGLKHSEFLPEIIPTLIIMLKDVTPAVARQSIACGIDIFRCTLVKIAIQGLYSSELDETLESSWEWVLKLRDEIYSLAFQTGSDGRRLLALKFIESVILLYTPDPAGSSEPPKNQNYEGTLMEFNMSWLRGGHPVLNVGDLSKEASQSLGLLLDQLRIPTVSSVSNLMLIVLINSLSTIAKKRPAFYGRILPVLLGLGTSSSASKGIQASGAHLALKNAFLSCLKCTHTGATPWRNRLIGALDEMKGEVPVEEDVHQVLPRTNGTAESKDDSSFTQEEKPSIKACDDVKTSSGKKRSATHGNNDPSDDDNVVGKRARTAPNNVKQDPKSSKDNGPVQQLVAMFGALVAQGEKAAGSLDILVSSICSDLLAEVVMTNIWNLPSIRPMLDEDETQLNDPNIDADFIRLSSYLSDFISMSSTFSQTDDIMDAQPSVPDDLQKVEGEQEEQPMVSLADTDLAMPDINYIIQQTPVTTVSISPQEDIPSQMDIYPITKTELADIEDIQNEMPCLDATISTDILPNPVVDSSLDPGIELDELDQEQVTSISRSSLEIAPSVSNDEKSEELSSKAELTDATSVNTSALGFSSQLVLPKMSAPVITLADEQRDNIQKSAFVRIIEAYKQIIVAGGSQVRSAVLACLAVEFPLELDPWKLLQTHILSDYVNLEGHDLTLRVLYRLYSEAEADRDFFSSTTATSVYEMFLLTVVETLRDSFPASDKSLSRLLGEVPYLPKSILKVLENLCSPGNADNNNNSNKDGKDNGDRVTQGLSTVWSLILLRPPIRDVCLNIALQSAVHHLEEVRMKAIRLVANKLYPLPSISQQIEDFAKEMLFSITKADDQTDADGSNMESLHKDLGLENTSLTITIKDTSADGNQPSAAENVPSSSTSEVQRCMSLYFALCTKKHSLFRQVFIFYEIASEVAKQAVHRQIPILVRTMGSSSQLLEIISDPPKGSETLLVQVLQTLTEGTIPSQELIFTIKKLYDTKVKDPEVLIPVLSFLQKDEVLAIFPRLVNLPAEKFQAVLSHVLRGSKSGQLLTPAEVLIAIHGIDPDSSGIPLKKVTDACNACFEQRQIFTQQVIAKVLNQLVEQIPLPLLFMRTVLQAIGAFPSLVEFIMEILVRLVNKQIWKHPKLWVGFLKCAQLTKPQSFAVLLQLPPAQLENALNRIGALKAPLIAHASQPHIRTSLPRSVLVVLGLATDPQNASQPQPTPVTTSTETTTNSDKESLTEKSKESSSAAS